LETKTAGARAGWKAGLEYAVKRMLATPAQAAAVPDGWKQAIDNELVSLHIGTAESFATPELALKEVIDWHVQVSLDPSVSSDAEALVERGRRAAAVPEGWKLAPVEPTQAMCTAAQELNEYDTRRGALTLNSNIYRTMIDAAPEAGAGGDK
jgi:uncharacterized protein YbdZ (MbtH family)